MRHGVSVHQYRPKETQGSEMGKAEWGWRVKRGMDSNGKPTAQKLEGDNVTHSHRAECCFSKEKQSEVDQQFSS